MGRVSAATPTRRIACEEGFSLPELIDAVDAFMAKHADREPGLASLIGPGGRFPRMPQLLDPELRIADMDRAGVSMQVLLLNSPGVQIFEAGQGAELARLANDRAAGWMRQWPDRFAPLAAFAPQDPDGAAQELERAVRSLGFKGGIVNSSTNDRYLSDTRYWPILEAAEALDVPIYLHPREPRADMLKPYLEQNLQGAVWGYAAEAGLHAMSMIMAGVFDHFPKLKIVLGHNGEGIPFYLDRIDNRYMAMNRGGTGKLKRRPSAYFRENFYVTTSGTNWAPAVRLCQEVLGADRVLFAIDYPFEDGPEAVRRADAIGMNRADSALFFHANAERVFKIHAATSS
ncbi:amidohydrolase family protein [Sphingomonas sp.]|uniref:amidohydrolase family protein n=1 Tax=Sphingomonas sp. TaxID=28214 RepID=UPI0025FD38B6|nr:amidohydrolase family protein [Sphingomonas sp.]